MYEWQKAERHRRDYDRIAQKHGFTDKRGRLVRFDSRLFWPEFHERGHTTADFTRCACRER